MEKENSDPPTPNKNDKSEKKDSPEPGASGQSRSNTRTPHSVWDDIHYRFGGMRITRQVSRRYIPNRSADNIFRPITESCNDCSCMLCMLCGYDVTGMCSCCAQCIRHRGSNSSASEEAFPATDVTNVPRRRHCRSPSPSDEPSFSNKRLHRE